MSESMEKIVIVVLILLGLATITFNQVVLAPRVERERAAALRRAETSPPPTKPAPAKAPASTGKVQ